MTVIVLVAVPPGLRGHVTRWLVEVAPGVFVGRIRAKIRARLWETICERLGQGQAIVIHAAHNEQRWVAETSGIPRWTLADFDGLQLFRRITGSRVAQKRLRELG